MITLDSCLVRKIFHYIGKKVKSKITKWLNIDWIVAFQTNSATTYSLLLALRVQILCPIKRVE